MSNLIKIDFRKEQRRDIAGYQSFERALRQHERRQKLKMAWMMISFCLLVVAIGATPFIIDYIWEIT